MAAPKATRGQGGGEGTGQQFSNSLAAVIVAQEKPHNPVIPAKFREAEREPGSRK